MFRKAVSLVLVGAQLSLAAPLAQAGGPSIAAERQLLEAVITLQGLGLSESELLERIPALVSRYDGSAAAEGRDERLQVALVEMGILTDRQGRRFAAEARAAGDRLSSRLSGTPERRAQAKLEAQLEVLSKVRLNGAQFAGDDGIGLCIAGALGLVGGLVSIALGSWDYGHNPSCHDDLSSAYSCQADVCYGEGDYRTCTKEWITCYDTVCDQPGYYPDRPRGRRMMIWGGVATGAGILLLVLGNRAGCD